MEHLKTPKSREVGEVLGSGSTSQQCSGRLHCLRLSVVQWHRRRGRSGWNQAEAAAADQQTDLPQSDHLCFDGSGGNKESSLDRQSDAVDISHSGRVLHRSRSIIAIQRKKHRGAVQANQQEKMLNEIKIFAMSRIWRKGKRRKLMR